MSNITHVLASGREIQLTELRQEAVYFGLLEGLPTREMNQEQIDRLIEQTTERTGLAPHLIEPVQTPIVLKGKPYPFGDPARLPDIACVADFMSTGRDVRYFTSLTVIWFQDDYAFPLGESMRAALHALDWDAHAHESEW
jgi:hypothetical protein